MAKQRKRVKRVKKTTAPKKRTQAKSISGRSGAATGVVAANFHEAGRSEILADYLFSAWGTVTPVRRQSDYGLDLYCTLTERIGQRARVREYFSVQVKSGDSAVWSFNDPASVKWLVEHPLPLFLCSVNKKTAVVRIYHTIPRFQIWALGRTPNGVELVAGNGHTGEFNACASLPTCSLSAPILEVGLPDLTDDLRMEQLRGVFNYWVALDRDNCELVRAGLLRFRRPHSYNTNELPLQVANWTCCTLIMKSLDEAFSILLRLLIALEVNLRIRIAANLSLVWRLRCCLIEPRRNLQTYSMVVIGGTLAYRVG